MHTLDWIIIALYVSAVVCVGGLFARKQKSANEFLLGGRRFGAFMVSVSVIATSLSAITFLGVPGFVFHKDWSLLIVSLMDVPGSILVGVLVVPIYYKLKITSAYQFLGDRFDLKVATLNSVMYILLRSLLAGIAVYAPSLALSTVTGWNLNLCILSSGTFTLLYATMGGMSAVIWTDLIQFTVLVGGALCATIYLLFHIPGSPSEWWTMASQAGKLNALDTRFSLSEITVWNGVLGGVLYSFAFYGVDQTLVQRYLASSGVKEARRSLLLNATYSSPVTLIFFALGTLLWLFFTRTGTAVPANLAADQIFPYFIMTYLPTGLVGLLIAAIYSGSMSTLSGVLNSISAVVLNDFYRPFINQNPTERQSVRIARFSTVAAGLISIGVALLSTRIGHSISLLAIKLGSLFMAPMLGTFLLGLFTRRANAFGTLIGATTGGFLTFLIGFGTTANDLWLMVFGTALTCIVGYGISLFSVDLTSSAEKLPASP